MIQTLSAFFLGVGLTVLVVALLTHIARKRYDVVEREHPDDDRRNRNRHPKS